MSTLKILTYPNDRLREKAEPVKKFDNEIQSLVNTMFDTMREAGGVGLSGTQVGISKRIIVARVDIQDLVIINPVIVKRLGTELDIEGCLSVPNRVERIARAANITVVGKNTRGDKVRYEVEGILARIIQHEIDHLDGKLFIDYVDGN